MVIEGATRHATRVAAIALLIVVSSRDPALFSSWNYLVLGSGVQTPKNATLKPLPATEAESIPAFSSMT